MATLLSRAARAPPSRRGSTGRSAHRRANGHSKRPNRPLPCAKPGWPCPSPRRRRRDRHQFSALRRI